MRKRNVFLLLFLLPVYCFCQHGLIVVKDVTIVDIINNKVIPERTIVVEGNKIIAAGSKVSFLKHATVLEAKGKFVIPGLWDMHTHSLRKGRSEYFFPLFVTNGVTGIRDMASDMSLEEINALRNEIETGKIVGPRLGAVTGKIVDGPPQPDTLLFTYPPDTAAAIKLVRTYKQLKADFIKVYNMLDEDIYLAIVAEAKKEKIPFAGHVPFSITATEASHAGQQSIEHLSDILISASANELAIRRDLTVSPTAIQGTIKRMQANFKAIQTYDEAKAMVLFPILSPMTPGSARH